MKRLKRHRCLVCRDGIENSGFSEATGAVERVYCSSHRGREYSRHELDML